MHYPLTEVRLQYRDGRNHCWSCELAAGTELQHFIVSQDFLSNTIVNPHGVEFQVNGLSVEDDYLLMPGDRIVGTVEDERASGASELAIAVEIKINASDYCKFKVVHGTSLGELSLARDFLEVTTAHPRSLAFIVRGNRVKHDYLLMDGDQITASLNYMEKGCTSAREVIKKLEFLVGLQRRREGGKHSIWETSTGLTVVFPRHARDLRRGTLRKILKQAGIQMGLDRFLSLQI